jgi:WD40 repeat protein
MMVVKEGDINAYSVPWTTGEIPLALVNGHTNSITSLASDESNEFIVTGSYDKTAILWDVHSDGISHQYTGPLAAWLGNLPLEQVKSILSQQTQVSEKLADLTVSSISDDHQSVIVQIGPGEYARNDIETGAVMAQFKIEGQLDNSPLIFFSRNDKQVQMFSYSGDMWVFDAESGKLLSHDAGSSKGLLVAQSPDGRYLAKMWPDKVDLIDTDSGKSITLLKGDSPSSRFSADGKLLQIRLVQSPTTTYVYFDVASGAEIGRFTTPGAIVLAPDDQSVIDLSAPGVPMRRLDLKTGAVQQTYVNIPPGGSDGFISPDGKYLVADEQDGTEVVDLTSGEEIRHFQHGGILGFMPDGQTIISSNSNLFPIDYRVSIAEACQRISRDFTADERKVYGINDNAPTCPQFANAVATEAATQSATQAATLAATEAVK